MKQIINDYFNFTRQERIGVIGLTILLLFIFILPRLTTAKKQVKDLTMDTAWVNSMRKLEKKNRDSANESETNPSYMADRSGNNPDNIKATSPDFPAFYFNPNTLSTGGWKKLGISDKTIQTIQNYLSKGGTFKKPEDLQKIYGLNKSDYERLVPYIKIEKTVENKPQEQPLTEEATKNIMPSDFINYTIIELNTADTTALIALPGIGSKLAARIINFRDKLGGFYSIEQIKETYGLQDSVFQRIKQFLKVNSSSVKKINLNTVTLDELKNHPYFRYNIGNPVILYRNEHGAFSRAEDIKKVMAVSEELYNKIAPYISVQ